MARVILQSADGLELRFTGGAGVDPAQIAQAQIGVVQIRLRLNQLGLFVGQRDLGAAHIQRTHESRRSIVRAGFSIPRAGPDRLLPHMDFFAVQQQVVKSEPHVHRDAIGHALGIPASASPR